jgi:hypothetical protein
MTARQKAEKALRQAGVTSTITNIEPVAPVISPMCRAADWTCLRVTTGDDGWFIKVREPDAADFVRVEDAAAGARAASAQGFGPALRFADADAGVMAFALLPPPWREARLSDLANAAVLAEVLAAKKAMHTGPALDRTWDVFDQIDALVPDVRDAPGDMKALRQAAADIRLALLAAGQDRVPAHADGVASNIMIDPDGRVRLVDFDCAGMTDPHYDIGVVLNEAFALDAEWHAGIEIAFGKANPADLNRCRVFAIADDLLWGLWGLSRHAMSARRELEFFKYASWRLLRCRMALGQPGHGDRLHHL